VKYANPSLTPRSPKGDVSYAQSVGNSPSGDLRGAGGNYGSFLSDTN
jgi:hypothetical protein